MSLCLYRLGWIGLIFLFVCFFEGLVAPEFGEPDDVES